MQSPHAANTLNASPSVRRLARELGVDLQQLASDSSTQITEETVRQSQSQAAAHTTAPATTGSALPSVPAVDWGAFGRVSTTPMSRIGKLSAQHLHTAWLNVPQVTHFDEADITELEAYRQSLKPKAKAAGVNMTPLVFMLKAVVAGLQAFPKFNSALDASGEHLIERHYYHLGVAVNTPQGLVVPVIRDVDRKSLFTLAQELGDLSQKARAGRLKAQDMQGGCFSISSLGGIGGTQFTPLVNAPEVGILGLTRARQRVEVIQGEMQPRLMQPLAVSYDHRVIDGAYAAEFTDYLAKRLQDVRDLLLRREV